MGKLLLHICFTLRAKNLYGGIQISDYKDLESILLYDKFQNPVDCTIHKHIHMSYLDLRRIEFQCDYLITTSDNIPLIPKQNQMQRQKLISTDTHHKFENVFNKNYIIILLEHGYELWIDCPNSFLYQIVSQQSYQYLSKCHDICDIQYLDINQRHWEYDLLSYSIIDENLNLYYL